MVLLSALLRSAVAPRVPSRPRAHVLAALLSGGLAAACGAPEVEEPEVATEALVGDESDHACHGPTPAGCTVTAWRGHEYLRCDGGPPVPRVSGATAEARCAAWGGFLVEIDDAEENAYVASLAATGTASDYYVGGRPSGATWRWPDQTAFYDGAAGAPIDGAFVAWASGEPSSANGSTYVAMRGGEWFAVRGSDRRGYVCEARQAQCQDAEACGDGFDDDADGAIDCADDECSESAACEGATETSCDDQHDGDGDASPDCEDADCAADAACPSICPGPTPPGCVEVVSGDRRYYACAPATWLEARDTCTANGFALATPEDAAERRLIGRLGRDFAAAEPRYAGLGAWVGATDRGREGEYRRVDGAPLPEDTVWASGEPRQTTDDTDCAIVSASGALAMRRCALQLPFVCEPRAALCDPPVILTQPRDQTVREPAAATFSVVARGNQLTYQWQRNGVDLPGATGATLVYEPTSAADAGARFRVVVTSPWGSVTSSEATLTVREIAPRIVEQPADATVYEAQPVTFRVVAQGSSLTYQWSRGSTAIAGATGPELTLPAVALSDDGATFRCRVTNALGAVNTRAARLHVHALPRITAQPASVAVLEGEPATFTVAATGEPPLAYQWRRGGAAIEGATEPSFTIESTALADDGAVLTVTVSNEGGSVTSAPATLDVTRPAPVILAGLSDVSVAEGERAAFSVVATGAGLTYRWERDGAAIAGATGPSYEIAAVSGDDEGARFRVVVSNEGGSVESSAVLHVAANAPEILAGPSDATVVEGSPATFEVIATGSGLAYQWERDGAPIAGARSASYTLARADLDDEGATFRCVVSNRGGSVTSRAAILHVTPRAPQITSGPDDASVLEGDDATFRVSATGSGLAYAWRRDGVPVASATSATLVLPGVTLADDGAQVVAVVSNAAGSVESRVATLSVRLRAPRIVSQPADVTVDEGSPASFEVVAEGSRLAYQWRRDGIAIAGATSATYTLPATTYGDRAARFDCVVSNAGGSATSGAATLTVTLGPPRIVSHPGDASVREGEPASFRVEAAGSELAYEWLRNGEVIPGATTATLAIAAARIDDDGASYAAVVRNAAGSVSSTPALLHVALLPPEITSAPADVTVREGDAFELTVVARGSRLTYEWERDGVLIEGATYATHRVPAATLGHDGARYRVTVRNAAGAVGAEASVRVTVRAPRIATQPAGVTVDEGAPARFEVVAEGSGLAYQWQRDGADVPGANASALELARAAWADRGASFRVVVSNAGGSVVSDAAVLDVRQRPPAIVTQPASQTVREGDLARFSVLAEGSELSYEWRVDGAVVAGATAATLELGPVAPADDDARVQARVWNAAGEILSEIAVLRVERNAPVITEQPNGVEVVEGEVATFRVEASGAESYQWRRGGVVIAGATEPTYSLTASLADEGAVFDVEVGNPGGSVVSLPATLTVRVAPPRVLEEPADLEVSEGEGATFRVVASGTGLRYQWRREGVEIPGATAASHAIDAAALADDGARFDCVVENAGGRVSTRAATLTVRLAAPVIVAAPESLSVDEGGTATFRVSARGSLLAYQWQRDGADVVGATTDSLVVSPVALGDDGARFTVRVWNAAGSVVTPAATLRVVAGAPLIVRAPEALTVVEGEPATFSVEASGAGLSYAWERDGSAIPGASAASFTIAETALADDGALFRVVVSNASGTAASAPVRLTVRPAPPRLVRQPADVSEFEGRPAGFSIEAAGSLLTYQWQRDGVDVPGATVPALIVPALTRADDGAVFRCVVTNPAGSVTSAAATLRVRHGARIEHAPQGTSVIEGEPATFTVEASGEAPLVYQWSRDGVAIAGATGATYTIDATQLADDGARFTVTVSNGGGSVTSEPATLRVTRPAPELVSGLTDVAAREGSMVALEVLVRGSGLVYAWTRDGAPLPGVEGPRYVLASVGEADDGAVFAVTVSNEGGSVSSAATLRVTLDAPVIAMEPGDAVVAEGEPATFAVEARGTSLTYRWERDGVAIAGASRATYTLARAEIEDDGATFRCIVSNGGGSAVSRAAVLDVTPRAPVITSAPADASVLEGEDATFRVAASGSRLVHAWRRDGVLVEGATGPELVLRDVSLADDGAEIVAVVSNETATLESAPATLRVGVRAPVITSQPASTTVDEGASALFSVTAAGSRLTYQWRRDGAAIAGATSATLVLPVVAWADRGARFDCVVANEGGSVTSAAATLGVSQIAPRIVVGPADASVREGETARFEVGAEGSELRYQWLRDGVEIAGATSAELALVAGPDDDGARFEVRVANDAGAVTSAAATLRVALLPPEIVRAPADVLVDEGASAELSAEIRGSRLTITWEREGVPVAGASSATLRVDPATLADDGARFRVIASNAAGTVSAEATLRVRLVAPRIVAGPSATTADEGGSATFTVIAQGSELTYQWQREGVDVPGATGASHTHTPVLWSDRGAAFRVVVSNAAGGVTSDAATLDVRQRPPVIVAQPASQTVREGERARFTVEAQGSELSYEWQVDGAVVLGATSSTLELGPLSLEDDGSTVRARVWNAAGEALSETAILGVARAAPAIVAQPSDLAVFEDEPATFTVEALRADAYQWRRDGVDIAGATSAVFTLPAASLADDGARFECLVSNSAGDVLSSAAALSVRVAAPRVVSEPADLRVVEGASARFEVSVLGSRLRYQWRRGGVEIAGATGAAYELATATLAEDGATFDCVIENEGGRVTTRAATLRVDVAAPSIVAQPIGLAVDEGGTATFAVTARGSLLTYQWTRDGADVAGATGASLELRGVTLEDDGARFAVRVANAGGTVTSSEAVLSVRLLAPRITRSPEDRAVDEGAAASFAVEAAGSRLRYQWRRDGADIEGAVSASYTLAAAALADEGALFDCVVSNDAGSATSGTARLSVRQLPPSIVRAPAAVTVDEGQDASFSVEARGSGLAYRWERDGAVIAGASGASLTLAATRMADDGASVRVVVSNAAGEVASEPVRLTVRALPPRITAQPESLTVVEGEPASFHVVAAGHEISYQWRRDGVELAGATSATHAIPETSLADDGASFDCVITNVAGSVTSSAVTLTVSVAPPRIVRAPSPVIVEEGRGASFDVEAAGSRLTYQWQRDGADVAGATGPSLVLTAPSPDDDGATFRVVVSNAGGSVTSAPALLTVQLALPRIATPPADAEVDEGAPVSFHVEAIGSRLTYQWQHDGADIAGATGATHAIAAASLADRGEYRVRIANAAGAITSEPARLSLRLRAPRITEHPATQIVRVGESASLRVVAEGSELAYQWFKDGFAIDGARSATLALATIARADQGAYHCEVTNSGGVARSSEAVITVRSAVPRIVTQPEDATVALGESVTFRVVAEGEGLTYQWQRFGADVAGATGAQHTFGADEADDGVPFHVVVRNDGGEVVSRDAVVRLRDASAPSLEVSGATERTTSDTFVVLRGSASDDRSTPTVRATTDRFAGQTFAATPDGSATFELEVPLALGDNVIAIVASDAAGNTSPERTVRVRRDLPSVPRVAIAEPASGSVTTSADTRVRGTLLTSLDPDDIRLTLGELVAFPTGSDGAYEFVFERVPLALGTNVLTVVAHTAMGDVSASVNVVRGSVEGDGGPGGGPGAQPPSIAMPGVRGETYYATDRFEVRGTVDAARCVAEVTVNGAPARLTAAGASASFAASVAFGELASLDVRVVATDCDGLTASASYRAIRDADPPVIELDGLVGPPAVNPVLESPARISGTIRDPSLAGVAIGGSTLGLLPSGEPGVWTFSTTVPLVRAETRTVRIAAWDRAGHDSERSVQLRLDAQLDLALVSPVAGERIFTEGATADVRVSARANGLRPDDRVVATIDGASETQLAVSGGGASGVIPGVASSSSHTVRVQVRSASGDVLAQASATFEVVDNESIPLEVVEVTPSNGQGDVEPNAFLRVSFNRPIDPARLEVELLESVHGLQYVAAEDGTDIRRMSEVEMADTTREREPVAGNVVAFPGNTMMLFYPSRDLAYGGEEQLEITYDGRSVLRTTFRVRALPTLVHGFVADHEFNPLPGIEIVFPELGLAARTNSDGLWDLGFGWTADRALPPGRHRAIVNPGMRDARYGTVEVQVLMREGESNDAGIARLPFLDPLEPFRRVASGESAVILSRGDLTLDLSSATLVFGDGSRDGDVHAQMMPAPAIAYPSAYPVEFGFSLQPAGIGVEGSVGVRAMLPLRQGTHDYVELLGERMLVLAVEPRSLMLEIVGVARVDVATHRASTEGGLALRRLDYVAFAVVAPAQQALLARYAAGEISLAQLRSAFDLGAADAGADAPPGP